MAATYSNIQGLFKTRYGRWIEPLPDEHTLADAGDFIPAEMRPGLGYSFPVLTGPEHGQTANTDNSAFNLNAAVDSRVSTASLDGATILVQAQVSYDTIYKSLNGAGNGNNGGAFKTALDQVVQAMLMGAGLYRELALAYGPGTGSALASNIGVVSASVSGANLAAPQVVRLTAPSWIPGLWIMMQGAIVDIYQSDLTTIREFGVTVTNRVNTTQTRLTLTKAGSAATVAAGDVIIPGGTQSGVVTPTGWKGRSCYGLEAIYNNTGSLFGIDAGSVAPWRCLSFSAGSATLSAQKILGYAAQVSINGCKNGGKLFVSAATFADLVFETLSLQRYTGNTDKVKRQGASVLTYETAAGVIDVIVYQYAKQGQAFFIANDNFRRVGSTDLTMKPIGGGAEAFFTHLTTAAGAQLKIFSNQAPVFEMPYRNFIVTAITNSSASGAAIDA